MKAYSSFDHLVLSVCSDRGKGWRFVMVDALTVYVDDSGSNSKSNIAAAAFCVSTVERWQTLLEKWRKIASDAGFDLKDFHMTEVAACRHDHLCDQCRAGKTSAIEHPWQKWSESKRKSVLIRMAKAVTKYVEFGVGHAYTKADYDEHVKNSSVRLIANEPIGDEYFTFAVQRCGGSLAEWRAAKSRMVPLKFVFDTASKREKKEIARVFFGAANDRAQHENGIEQWFDPELGVSYESRKQTHQLLSADILAWTMATIRAREIFPRGRFMEAYWIGKTFAGTRNIRMGYMPKDSLVAWEKGKIDEATKSQSGIPEFRSDNEKSDDNSAQRDQGETGSREGSEKEEKS
jgi:hypothetical protein